MQIAEVTGKRHADKQKGIVYIADNGNMIKIGRTKDLARRISTIENISGIKVKRVAFSPYCNNYCDIETQLHKTFKDNREAGEWFSISFQMALSELDKCTFDTSERKPKENVYLKLFEMAMQMK